MTCPIAHVFREFVPRVDFEVRCIEMQDRADATGHPTRSHTSRRFVILGTRRPANPRRISTVAIPSAMGIQVGCETAAHNRTQSRRTRSRQSVDVHGSRLPFNVGSLSEVDHCKHTGSGQFENGPLGRKKDQMTRIANSRNTNCGIPIARIPLIIAGPLSPMRQMWFAPHEQVSSSSSRHSHDKRQWRFIRILRLDLPASTREIQRGHDQRSRIFVEHAMRGFSRDGWCGNIQSPCHHQDWRRGFFRRIELSAIQRQLVSVS